MWKIITIHRASSIEWWRGRGSMCVSLWQPLLSRRAFQWLYSGRRRRRLQPPYAIMHSQFAFSVLHCTELNQMAIYACCLLSSTLQPVQRATNTTMFLIPACVWHVVCICRHFSAVAHTHIHTLAQRTPGIWVDNTKTPSFSCSESYLLHPCTGCYATHASFLHSQHPQRSTERLCSTFCNSFPVALSTHKSLFKNYVLWLRLRASASASANASV